MSLKNTLENLDSVDEKFKGFYTKTDSGSYELADALRADDTSALTNALERQKGDIASFKTKQTEMQAKIDADAIALAKAQGNEAEVERLKQQALDNQKTQHDADNKAKDVRIHELTIGATRDSISAEVYLNHDAWKLTDMESRIKVGEDGKTTFLTNKLGETVTRAEFIAELRTDPAMAFAIRGESGSGGGRPNAGGEGNSFAGKKMADMSLSEKKAYLKSKNSNLK